MLIITSGLWRPIITTEYFACSFSLLPSTFDSSKLSKRTVFVFSVHMLVSLYSIGYGSYARSNVHTIKSKGHATKNGSNWRLIKVRGRSLNRTFSFAYGSSCRFCSSVLYINRLGFCHGLMCVLAE